MESKYQELLNYSNPETVLKLAQKYYGDDVYITVSTRKDKKYMLLNPNTNKFIHFGLLPYEDYTYHKNLLRRNNFKNRNKKWANAEKYSPAYASYYLLW